MAKLVYAGNPNDDDIWREIAARFADIKTVERINFPRVTSRSLTAVCGAIPGLEAAIASNIAHNDLQIDLDGFKVKNKLKELKIKVGNAKVKVKGGHGLKPLLGMAKSLEKLVIF